MGMKKDQTSSLICLSLGLFVCVETLWKLPLGSWRDPGPGFWPFGSGLALGLSGDKSPDFALGQIGGRETSLVSKGKMENISIDLSRYAGLCFFS